MNKQMFLLVTSILMAIANTPVLAMSPFDIPPYGQQELLMGDIELEGPTAMAFDSMNRPYLLNNRNPTSYGLLRTVRDGEWVTVSLRAILGDENLITTTKAHALGEMVIDDADALYATIGGKLIYSPDLGETLKAYPVEGTLELRVGPNSLSAPPAISLLTNSRYVDRESERTPEMAWWAKRGTFSVLLPTKDNDGLVLGDPILITDNCQAVGSGGHSGGTSFAVTRAGKTHVVYGELPADPRSGGNPICIATVDRATRTVVARRMIVPKAPPTKADVHTRPTMTMDSEGYLHVLSGSHGQPFLYVRSLVPNDITAGWTEPVQLTGRQTYASIVCDDRDRLHAIYREWIPHASLGYASTSESDGKWSLSKTLVHGANKGTDDYGILYHRLFIDRASNLYANFTFWEQTNQSTEGYPDALAVSRDYGKTWQLARKDGLASNQIVSESIFETANFSAISSITGTTPALTFNTDTLEVSGGLSGTGQFGRNEDGSVVAVFCFTDINLTRQPVITGSRSFVLMSKSNLQIAANISVKGQGGNHETHGEGVAGGGDGGDANRPATPGHPLSGQGPGGSAGNSSGVDDSASGGGGFGGAGGSGTSAGGAVYGDRYLFSLTGGSGAGGTWNKGGGAGGGGIALVAAGHLEIVSGVTIEAQGGNGAASGSQLTSGGGSGGAILLRGSAVTLNGTLNANGGNGGNASGGQTNGGGGGGGRIAVYYVTSLDTTGASLTVNGGLPMGSHATGQPGADGTLSTIMGINAIAHAGADQTVTYTDNSGSANVTLDGTSSSDPDGTIVSYIWNDGIRNIATGVTPSASLQVGQHRITLTVTDNDGNTDTDTVDIIVNALPVADAGLDQTITLDTPVPWTPGSLPTVAWYDASDVGTLTQSNGIVSQWNDKSGNAKDLMRGEGSAGPLTGGRAINGLNVVDLDGIADYMLTSGGLGANINSMFLVAASDVSVTPSSQPRFLTSTVDDEITSALTLGSATGAFANEVLTVMDEDDPDIYIDRQGVSSTALSSIDTNAHLYANLLATNWFIGFDGSGDLRDLSSGTRHPLLYSNSFSIGAATRRAGSYDLFFDGRMAEVICIARSVSAETRRKLEGYLGHKWGLAANLPDSHPYKTAAPSLEGFVAVANLDGSASDAGGDPLMTNWTVVSKPAGATVTFGNVRAVDTTATFTETGSYLLRLTVNDGYDTVDREVTITVMDGPAYETWDAWTRRTFAHDFNDTALTSDPDGDGYINLLEFAFGMDPTMNALGSFAFEEGGSVTEYASPTLFEDPAGSGTYHAVFGRRKDHQAAGLTYTVEFSADLSVWTASTSLPTVLTHPNSSGEIEAVSIPYPASVPVTGGDPEQKPKFYRIKVSSD